MQTKSFKTYILPCLKWIGICFATILIVSFIFAIFAFNGNGAGLGGLILMMMAFVMGLPISIVLGIIIGTISTNRKLKM